MWVARDKNKKLHLFTYKPIRSAKISAWTFDFNTVDGYDERRHLPTELFPNLKWKDEPIEVDITEHISERNQYITLTTYYDDMENSRKRFMNMLKNSYTDRYDTPEKLENAWDEPIKKEYHIDEISSLIQCDGYTKVVFPMRRNDCQPDYDRVVESKEYIEKYFNRKF